MDISNYLGMTTRQEGPTRELSKTDMASTSAVASNESIEGIFAAMAAFISEDLVKQVKGVFLFDVKGEPQPFFVDLKNGSGACGKGKPPKGNPDVTLTMEKDTFIQLFSGKLNPTSAFMAGKLSLKGDLPVAMKLDRLMGQMKSKL